MSFIIFRQTCHFFRPDIEKQFPCVASKDGWVINVAVVMQDITLRHKWSFQLFLNLRFQLTDVETRLGKSY